MYYAAAVGNGELPMLEQVSGHVAIEQRVEVHLRQSLHHG